jgi:hypothetical protein
MGEAYFIVKNGSSKDINTNQSYDFGYQSH